jgi:hypothetical protein
MSRNYLRQAEEELGKGDALQGAEKVWGAAAAALKAVAQERGWNHRYHNHLRSVAFYLAVEWDRPDWNTAFAVFESVHTNFYEHQWYVADVRPRLELVKDFCQAIAHIRPSEPPSQQHLTPEQERAQERHLRTLTRPINEQAAFGIELSEEEIEGLPPIEPPHV